MATTKAKPATRRAAKSTGRARSSRLRLSDLDRVPKPPCPKVRCGELPYEIHVAPVCGLDEGDSNEMSEWYSALIDGEDERGEWDLASDVLRHGFKITVKVSPGNAVRVAALVASLLTEPVVATYCSATETLAFWSQLDRSDPAERPSPNNRNMSDGHCCRCHEGR